MVNLLSENCCTFQPYPLREDNWEIAGRAARDSILNEFQRWMKWIAPQLSSIDDGNRREREDIEPSESLANEIEMSRGRSWSG